MYAGRTIFAQLLDHLPAKHFEYLCDKFQSNRWVQGFKASEPDMPVNADLKQQLF
jgi:hypothetical protein